MTRPFPPTSMIARSEARRLIVTKLCVDNPLDSTERNARATNLAGLLVRIYRELPDATIDDWKTMLDIAPSLMAPERMNDDTRQDVFRLLKLLDEDPDKGLEFIDLAIRTLARLRGLLLLIEDEPINEQAVEASS